MFLVGLAKLHCGATPPSMMVLFRKKDKPTNHIFFLIDLVAHCSFHLEWLTYWLSDKVNFGSAAQLTPLKGFSIKKLFKKNKKHKLLIRVFQDHWVSISICETQPSNSGRSTSFLLVVCWSSSQTHIYTLWIANTYLHTVDPNTCWLDSFFQFT